MHITHGATDPQASRHPCFKLPSREELEEIKTSIYNHHVRGGPAAPMAADKPGEANSGERCLDIIPAYGLLINYRDPRERISYTVLRSGFWRKLAWVYYVNILFWVEFYQSAGVGSKRNSLILTISIDMESAVLYGLSKQLLLWVHFRIARELSTHEVVSSGLFRTINVQPHTMMSALWRKCGPNPPNRRIGVADDPVAQPHLILGRCASLQSHQQHIPDKNTQHHLLWVNQHL